MAALAWPVGWYCWVTTANLPPCFTRYAAPMGQIWSSRILNVNDWNLTQISVCWSFRKMTWMTEIPGSKWLLKTWSEECATCYWSLLSEVSACGGQLPHSQAPQKEDRRLPQRHFNVVYQADKCWIKSFRLSHDILLRLWCEMRSWTKTTAECCVVCLTMCIRSSWTWSTQCYCEGFIVNTLLNSSSSYHV